MRYHIDQIAVMLCKVFVPPLDMPAKQYALVNVFRTHERGKGLHSFIAFVAAGEQIIYVVQMNNINDAIRGGL